MALTSPNIDISGDPSEVLCTREEAILWFSSLKGEYEKSISKLGHCSFNLAFLTKAEIKDMNKRFAGKGNYNLYKSTSLWLRVLTNFSVLPLRIATYVGIIASLSGFVLGLYFILRHFFGMYSPEGWPSLIVTILVIGGIQLLGMGIIGEYVGRSFIYQSKEPQFIIDKIIRYEE